jgi:hypothetical protein
VLSFHNEENMRWIFSRIMTARYFCEGSAPDRSRDFFCFVRCPEKIEGCLLVMCITTYFTVNRVAPVTSKSSAETKRICPPGGRLFVARVTAKRLADGDPLTADIDAASSGCS